MPCGTRSFNVLLVKLETRKLEMVGTRDEYIRRVGHETVDSSPKTWVVAENFCFFLVRDYCAGRYNSHAAYLAREPYFTNSRPIFTWCRLKSAEAARVV